MQFSAGVLGQRYPLRESVSTPKQRHSIRYSDATRRRVVRLWKRFVRELEIDPSESLGPMPQVRIAASGRLEPRAVAREFAAFTVALRRASGHAVSELHIGSALAMMCRQIDAIPDRHDRVICAGLVAAALARSGLRVHIITETEMGLHHPDVLLTEALTLLGVGVARVSVATDRDQRREAYQQPVVLLSARECAMDFLRDAINTPGRANAELQTANRLAGKLRHGGEPVMRGLPCAVLLDADSTLIDSARAPIVLTRDAAPIHEPAEIGRALEMSVAMEAGEHYHLTGQGAELQLTPLGKEQFDAWREQLGGIWQSSHLAQLLLGSAIAARFLIKPGVHYEVVDRKIHWLVQNRLIPGMVVYPESLLTAMMESLEECQAEQQKEVIARASYQQLFRHYLHLCGTSHEVASIRSELREAYGLRCRTAWPVAGRAKYQYASLPGDRDAVDRWLLAWARLHPADSCSVVIVADHDTAARLRELVAECVPDAIDMSPLEGEDFSVQLQKGNLLIVAAAQLDHQLPWLDATQMPPLRVVALHRSPRIAEDHRQQQWRRHLATRLRDNGSWLVLATDLKLFEGRNVNRLQRKMRLVGTRIGAVVLESSINRIQHSQAVKFRATRRALSAHDEVMQGMLAFTGKGLYGD